MLGATVRHGARLSSACLRRLATTDASLSYAQRFGASVKPSAFTGRPDYYEALFFMEDVLLRAQDASRPVAANGEASPVQLSGICKQLGGSPNAHAAKPEEQPRPPKGGIVVPWLPREAMAERVGFDLAPLEYRRIRDMLGRIAQHIAIPAVRDFVSAFTPASSEELGRLATMGRSGGVGSSSVSVGVSHSKPLSTQSASEIGGELPTAAAEGPRDALLRKYSSAEPHPVLRTADGRIVAEGRRKTSVARVQLVRGTGECLVNGRPAALHFQRPQEMLRLADVLGHAGLLSSSDPSRGVNAWLTVAGGGPAGQAGACAHALAKAAAAHRPECRDALVRAGGLLMRDPRVRERKKAGQPGARKKFTWVKR